jgi:hypothetical protein
MRTDDNARTRRTRRTHTRVGGAGHDEDLPLRGHLKELGEEQRNVLLLAVRPLVVAPPGGLVGPLAPVDDARVAVHVDRRLDIGAVEVLRRQLGDAWVLVLCVMDRYQVSGNYSVGKRKKNCRPG